MNKQSKICPLCGGEKTAGTTTFSADIGTGVVVVRHVSATVCNQCGEEWIDHATASQLQAVVADARAKHRQIEVADFAALPATA